MMMTVQDFVNKISNISDENRLIQNPYKKEMCRYNLLQYLDYLHQTKIQIMLIGEAPGYRGCALTGIPFTDEVQLKLAENTYALGTWSRHDQIGNTAERSASIMWSAIRKYNIIPLIWNIFPFHPYKDGNVNSNRTPTKAELDEGMEYVNMLMSIFNIQKSQIYAIGKKAKAAIGFIDEDHYVRHPSYDYKKVFPLQFDEKIGKLYGGTYIL